MLTNQRLTNAYRTAIVKEFDDNSKFIFFSDMHRGDDSISDEFARNQNVLLHALDYYYANGYTYIEVGDGDELWEYIDFKTIRFAHSDIFIVLKKFFDANRLILLYGNHNMSLRHKHYVKRNYYHFYDEYKQKLSPLFPGIKPLESLRLFHKKTGQEVFVVHGHQGDFMNDQFWPVSMFLLRFFWRYLHVVGFHNPASPAKNLFTRHKVEKSYKKWIRRHRKILLCGHTHRPHYPHKHELPYFNTGCCIRTKSITGIELTHNEISLVDWRIRSAKDGNLRIIRTVVQGPKSLSAFDFDDSIPYH